MGINFAKLNSRATPGHTQHTPPKILYDSEKGRSAISDTRTQVSKHGPKQQEDGILRDKTFSKVIRDGDRRLTTQLKVLQVWHSVSQLNNSVDKKKHNIEKTVEDQKHSLREAF